MTTTAIDDETRAAAAAVLGEAPFACPDCDFVGQSKAGLAQHRRQRHDRPRPAKEPARSTPADEIVEEVIGKTVANLQVVGGYLSIVLPHTGLAIAGVPGEKESDPPVVQSRAVLAGRVLGQWARRDQRVLRALDSFNRLFETSEVVELGVAVAAAVAVDIGAVPAELAVEVGPFTGERAIQPVRAVIGDVVDYVASLRPPEPARAPDGVAQDGAEVVRGDVADT